MGGSPEGNSNIRRCIGRFSSFWSWQVIGEISFEGDGGKSSYSLVHWSCRSHWQDVVNGEWGEVLREIQLFVGALVVASHWRDVICGERREVMLLLVVT